MKRIIMTAACAGLFVGPATANSINSVTSTTAKANHVNTISVIIKGTPFTMSVNAIGCIPNEKPDAYNLSRKDKDLMDIP